MSDRAFWIALPTIVLVIIAAVVFALGGERAKQAAQGAATTQAAQVAPKVILPPGSTPQTQVPTGVPGTLPVTMDTVQGVESVGGRKVLRLRDGSTREVTAANIEELPEEVRLSLQYSREHR